MKRFFALFLVLILCLNCLPATATEKAETVTLYFPGDVDGNGPLDAADALLVLQHSVGNLVLSGNALAAAQTDANGALDAVDALNILKSAVNDDFVMRDGRVQTSLSSNDSYVWWDTVEDNMSQTEQAWLCQTYEEYQAFLELGYVAETERKQEGTSPAIPQFDESFFDTYGLVLWYRVSFSTTGSLHWNGAFVKDNTVFMDLVPYGTDAIDDRNAWDSVYGFYYEKSHEECNMVLLRKCGVGQLYREYSYTQFNF